MDVDFHDKRSEVGSFLHAVYIDANHTTGWWNALLGSESVVFSEDTIGYFQRGV